MDTVGKKVFKIDHHWAKFEFAPSRGQVHVHLLAICDFPEIRKIYAETKNENMRAVLLQKWMEKQFCYTSGDEAQTVHDSNPKVDHPSYKYYSDVPLNEKNKDDALLCFYCQKHKCNAYCLRKKNKHAKES